MTHVTRFAALAILAALVLCVPVQAQTPEIDALRARAEAGDAEAQYYFGNLYAFGLGTQRQDYVEAMRWRRLAANQGHADAQHNLGFMYATGSRFLAEAVRWFRLALEDCPVFVYIYGLPVELWAQAS